MIRRFGAREYVPVAPLAKGMGGAFVWDSRDRELLIDLSASNKRSRLRVDDAPFDLTLPDLAGKSVSMAAYRGKKVLLFAWASW